MDDLGYLDTDTGGGESRDPPRMLVFVLGVLIGLAVGVAVEGTLAPQSDISAEEVRARLVESCKNNVEMLEEIERDLPTNGRGEITTETLRRVMRDAVNKCRGA